jgi:hypothetical protein
MYLCETRCVCAIFLYVCMRVVFDMACICGSPRNAIWYVYVPMCVCNYVCVCVCTRVSNNVRVYVLM